MNESLTVDSYSQDLIVDWSVFIILCNITPDIKTHDQKQQQPPTHMT